MLINILKMNGDTEVRQINPGQKLTGLRITSLVIESKDDVNFLREEQGRDWLVHDVMHRFPPKGSL